MIVYNLVQNYFTQEWKSSERRKFLGIFNKVPNKKIKSYVNKIKAVIWKSVKYALDQFKTDKELKKFAQEYSENIEFGFLFIKSLRALGFIDNSKEELCSSNNVIGGCGSINHDQTKKSLKKISNRKKF